MSDHADPAARPRVRLRSNWVWLGLLALAGFAIYSGCLYNGWVRDDSYLAVLSRWYEEPLHLSDLGRDLGALLMDEEMGYYRPGEALLFRAERTLFGLDPVPWHLTGIMLHILAAWTLFALGRSLLLPINAAGAAALLFLSHPLHGEAVSCIYQQISPAEALFSLAGIWALLSGRFVTMVLCTLAALSLRESALVLPALYALFVPLLPRDVRNRGLVAVLAALAIMAGYLLLRFTVLDLGMLQAGQSPPLITRVGTVGYLWLRTLLLPLPGLLSFMHDDFTATQFQVALGWAAITLTGLLFALALRRGQGQGDLRAPVLLAAALLTAGPYSGLISAKKLFSEHYLYLPLGLGLLGLAALIARVQGRRYFLAAAVLLACLWGGLSYARTAVFRDNISAFSDVLRAYPESVKAHLALAENYFQQGEVERARVEYESVLNLTAGNHPEAWNNLGDIYFRQGRYDKAEQAFLRAGEQGRRNLAVLWFNQGRYERIEPLLERLIETYPDDPQFRQMQAILRQHNLLPK